MAAPNPKWSRWIYASIVKHFQALKGSLVLIREGEATEPLPDRMEVRIDGPDYTQGSASEYAAEVTINVLVSAVLSENYQRIHSNAGIVVAAFTPSIKIYQYGDDDELLGCLTRSSAITTKHFGQVNIGMDIAQASVEATYTMALGAN